MHFEKVEDLKVSSPKDGSLLAVAILPEAFTEQNHLLNSTMKMVRGKITEKFKKELEFLFTPEAKEIKNGINIQAIQTWNS